MIQLEMVMRVDEPGQHEPAVEVDDFVPGLRRLDRWR